MLCQEDQYRPMSYYAHNLDVSSRTISNDLNDLEILFQKYDLTLERRPNYGVSLQGNDKNFERLILEFHNNVDLDFIIEKYKRQAEIIREIIIYEKVVTYQDLSAKLYVNSSIIFQDMENIRKFQNEYCQIISDRHGTRVEGTEYGKQKFLKEFFNYYINKCYSDTSMEVVSAVLSNYYSDTVVIATVDILESFCSILKRPLEGYYLNSLFIFLTTIAFRNSK